MNENKNNKYRRNVAAVIVNAAGAILACQRSDVKDAWQLPQGGIETDETEEEAFFRELEEEIGTRDVEILGRLEAPIRYDWPADYKKRGYFGQEQTYFLARFNTDISLMTLKTDGEFDDFQWLTAAQFISRLSGFKKDAYIRALEQFQQQFPLLLSK